MNSLFYISRSLHKWYIGGQTAQTGQTEFNEQQIFITCSQGQWPTAAGHCAFERSDRPQCVMHCSQSLRLWPSCYAKSLMTFLLALRKIHKKIIVFELSNNEAQTSCVGTYQIYVPKAQGVGKLCFPIQNLPYFEN